MTDIFLYPGETNKNDIKLSDPTVVRSGAVTDVFFEFYHAIEYGMKPWTAAGMGGLIVE